MPPLSHTSSTLTADVGSIHMTTTATATANSSSAMTHPPSSPSNSNNNNNNNNKTTIQLPPPSTGSPTTKFLPAAARQTMNRSERLQTAEVMRQLKAQFKQVAARSPFLKRKPAASQMDSIGYFYRSEIRTGRMLGRGGFSEVYEIVGFALEDRLSEKVSTRCQALRQQFCAHATNTGGRYVLKHLRLDHHPAHGGTIASFASAAADLLLEASLLLRFDHPHIISLHGLPPTWWSAYEDGSHDGFFLILDRLSCTLDECIDEWAVLSTTAQSGDQNHDNHDQQHDDDPSATPLPPLPSSHNPDDTTKMQYGLDLARALEYMHRHRLVYRDLKPCNVGFHATTGQLMLFDFGLSRELPPVHERDERMNGNNNTNGNAEPAFAMSCVGTKRYQAPEVLWEAIYNCQADLYGWALVVWETFALVRPYSSYDLRQHTKYVIQGHERPPLDYFNNNKHRHHDAPLHAIPKTLRPVLYKAWKASLADRSDAPSVCAELEGVVATAAASSSSNERRSGGKFQPRKFWSTRWNKARGGPDPRE